MTNWTGEQRTALYGVWDHIRKVLKENQGEHFTGAFVQTAFKGVPAPQWGGSLLEALLESGLANRVAGGNDTYSLASGLEAKLFRDGASEAAVAETSPVTPPDPEVQPPPPPPPVEDGPGDYYQLVLSEMGMVVLREELPPEEWGKRLVWFHADNGEVIFSGLMRFEHVWMLTEEAPLRQPMQNRKTQENVLVEIPRLRFSKMCRAAFWPVDSVKFCSPLDREKDPLVQHIMRFKDGVMNVGGPALG